MTLPAAGTGICGQIWANPQGAWFEFAEMRHELFLRTAGRVMPLPYSGRCKVRFLLPLKSLAATEQLRFFPIILCFSPFEKPQDNKTGDGSARQ